MHTRQSSDERAGDKTHGTSKTEGIVDRAQDTMRGAADQASDIADRTLAKGRDAVESVKEVSGSMKDAVDTSLKQQPMATLAVVAALGFVIGALWKS